jgi:hypothetical protein
LGLADAERQRTADVLRAHGGNREAAARALGITGNAVKKRLRGFLEKEFEVDPIPDELPSAEELLERRSKQFAKKRDSAEARHLIGVNVKIDGPIGLAFVGDPHVDDNGTDIELLKSHLDLFNKHEALLPLGIGDYSNNWVGRLARLYGQQSLSAAEAWVLVEWLVNSVHWLALVSGNHDAWSGDSDPIKWMAKAARTTYESSGTRLGLKLPGGRVIRVNARHDFRGKSQWSTTHGIGKAVQLGWRDHILTAGHIHVSGWQYVRDPMSGLISHCLRIGSYKRYDRYADELGLPNQTVTVCPVVIVRPQFADDDPRLLTPMLDPESAADFLSFLRKRKSERAA